MDSQASTTPIVCDMTTAPDTGPERLQEYQRLFTQALLGRERTADGIRFRLRAGNGVEAWVRDLAGREKACCAFFEFHITNHGDQIYWDATVIDNDTARLVLDEFFALPETAGDGAERLQSRLGEHGLHFSINRAETTAEVRHDAT